MGSGAEPATGRDGRLQPLKAPPRGPQLGVASPPARAAVDDAAVAAPGCEWAGCSGWRRGGGRRRGLVSFQEDVCVEGLQREFIKTICSCKLKIKMSQL